MGVCGQRCGERKPASNAPKSIDPRVEEPVMDPKQILQSVVELSISTTEVNVSNARILSGTRSVQSAATSMASAVEELSASIREIESSAQRSAHNVDESTQLTREGMRELGGLMRDITETGVVFETVSVKTRDLQGAVQNLGKIVDLITKIAGQTNLLALNATIEAARAGEHGRGFAVVAGEVKSLSNQTTDATKQIQAQINELNASFSDVIQSMNGAQQTINTVVQKSDKVSEDFRLIGDNSDSIASQISELAGIITQQKAAAELMSENMNLVVEKSNENTISVNRMAEQTERSVELIEAWRKSLAEQDIEDKVVLLAQADHILWKKRLLDMAVGRSTARANDFSDHTLCRLGKWYYSKDADEMRGRPAFAAIERPHKQVHHRGIEAAKCFERGLIDEGMEHFEALEMASAEVVAALRALAGAHQQADLIPA